MSWKPDVEEIERRREVARQMGGDERIRRQHERGKLTARERIDRLLDPSSFEEIGILAGHTSQREEMKGVSAPADGVVTGSARSMVVPSISSPRTSRCSAGLPVRPA